MHCVYCSMPIFNGEGVRVSSIMSLRLAVHPICLQDIYDKTFRVEIKANRRWPKISRRHQNGKRVRLSVPGISVRCLSRHHRGCSGYWRNEDSVLLPCACKHHEPPMKEREGGVSADNGEGQSASR